MFVLVVRLFQLQVLHGTDFALMSDLTRFNRVVIEAPRGSILDRNGRIFAENGLSYSITMDPMEYDKVEKSVPLLASFCGFPPDELIQKVKDINRKKIHTPVKLFKDADFRLLSIIEEHKSELPGLDSEIDQRRSYPNGRLASHVIGYLGEINQNEFNELGSKGYYYGQSIGRDGLEQEYEEVLKGKNGTKFQEKNYLNRILKDSKEIKPDPPEAGKSLWLTIDMRLQMAAEQAFGDTLLGALVAIDPRNGEILAMVSMPNYDPNEFTHVMTAGRVDSLFNDPRKPLFNRAIQATYPPGSTFKPLTALAGLENGFNEQTRFSSCHGSYAFGGRSFKCWKAGGHGSLNMSEAITNSCNVYFYQLGYKVGIEHWQTTAKIMGIGDITGVDLSGEVAGRLPTLDYYKNKNKYYSPGVMLNLAIGQGENDVTLLQLARYVGIIATSGIKTTPHLILGKGPKPERIVGISPESFDVVKRGMLGVVEQGTARSLHIPGHMIAGKTGTAQNPHGADHKIFIGFAPFENSTIAVACVAENCGDKSPSRAVMIVKRMLDEYFNDSMEISAAANQ
ncbi:MAG: penicillin-binding protein 2, partial [Candidatus Latescibacterota bacterium]